VCSDQKRRRREVRELRRRRKTSVDRVRKVTYASTPLVSSTCVIRSAFYRMGRVKYVMINGKEGTNGVAI